MLNRVADAVRAPVRRPVAEGIEDPGRPQQIPAPVHSQTMQAEALAAWFPQPKRVSDSNQALQTQPIASVQVRIAIAHGMGRWNADSNESGPYGKSSEQIGATDVDVEYLLWDP